LGAVTHEAGRLRFESALRLAERGGTLATDPVRGDAQVGCKLELLRGEMLREIGRSSDSIAAFERAHELAGDDLLRCQASMGIAAGYRVTGEFASAMQALGEAQPIAERLELTIERSRIHHMQGNLYFSQGRIAECDEQHVLALQFAEQSSDPQSRARALSGLGDARYAQGLMASALEYFRSCVALCEDQIRISGPNRCMIGHCLWYANQLDAAVAEAYSVCDDAQRFGVVPVQVFAQATLAQVLTEAGRFEEASASVAKALERARHAGSRRYEATVLSFSAEHNLRRGDRTQARKDLELALELARQTGLGFIGAALQGRLARVADSAEERAAHLAEGEALLKATGLAHNYLWFYRDAIESSLAARDWTCALHYAELLERKFPVEILPWVELMAERARAIAAAATIGKDAATTARLRHVRGLAVAAGNGWALAGIDLALT
jgi:tetratricopeptide (TPR) repeat protein